MSFSQILNLIFTFFAVLGGIDYVLDNRFGIGKEFERGLRCSANLVFCMVGFMTLAEWLGSVLTPLLGPALIKIGADPSLIAGLLLAIDSGGAVTAKQMALTEDAAILNGYFVSTMFGSAINGNITLSLLAVKPNRRKEVLLGLAMGIASIPVGCTVGGFMAGLDRKVIFGNMLPLTVLSLILVFSMVLAGDVLIKALKVFGKFMIVLTVAGVLIAALGELCGIEVLPSRMPFTEIMTTIGRIVLVLIGIFPLLGIVLKLLEKPLHQLAIRIHASDLDVKGLPVDLVNCFSTIDQLQDMTNLGILMNCAFGIGAGYALGDHFAYLTATAPWLCVPVLSAKVLAGLVSLALVFFLRKIQKTKSSS